MEPEGEMEVDLEVEPEIEWETIVDHEEYEICLSFPYQIRKIVNHKILKEYQRKDGYVECSLNSRRYLKQRIIALQFIPNPDDLPNIDHKNKIKNDNRIENLRFVTQSENMKNTKSKCGFEYEYFDNLPVPCQPFIFYNGHDLEGYSIDQELNIYFHNGLMFRKLQRLLMKDKYPYYNCWDIEGRRVTVFLNKIDL
jgi:hypothetical protein